MENLYQTILLSIFGTVISGGMSYLIWKVRKSDKQDEKIEAKKDKEFDDLKDTVKLLDKAFTIQATEFKRMMKDWDEKNVDKAFDSAKRCHERQDQTEKTLSDLKEQISSLISE